MCAKKRKTKKKSSKPKVYVSPYKALALCTALLLFCILLLFLVSTIEKRPSSSQNTLPSISERFEKSDGDNQTTQNKTAQNKNEAVKRTQEKSSQSSSTTKNDDAVAKSSTQSEKTQNKAPQTTPVAKSSQSTKSTIENQSQNTKTSKGFDFPKAQNNAQLIFVFDDGGQNLNHLNAFLSLPFPISVAVLPKLQYSKQAAEKVRQSGNELMLHQPMQALNASANPGPGAIKPNMSDDEIISTLFTNINEIGPIAGMNNHEGSAITADIDKMALILKVVSENGIFFLDSRTNVETKVPYVSKEMGYGYYERNIFLDNVKTKENALTELKKGLAIANKNGSVIMIGHIWSADFLPSLLKEVYPELKEKGYSFSVVSKSKAQKR